MLNVVLSILLIVVLKARGVSWGRVLLWWVVLQIAVVAVGVALTGTVALT